MIADRRIIQRDQIGFYYVRWDKNRKHKERLIESRCKTCGKEMFQHTWKGDMKERYCGHSCMPIWNKNKKYSESEKKNLDLSGLLLGLAWNKGKRGVAENTRLKMRQSHIGKLDEKSSHWKGGRTSISKRERRRIEYIEWRRAVFERDDFTCTGCHIRGGTLNAHHIKDFKSHPKLRTYISNGITLCEKCHVAWHKRIKIRMAI